MLRLLTSFIFTISFFLLAGPLQAVTLTVSTEGSGDICSTSIPCSLATANSHAQPGDLIQLQSGSYDTVPVPSQNGTTNQKITYRTSSNGMPTITKNLDLSNKQHLVYDGLKFTGKTLVIANSGTQHIDFRNCHFDLLDSFFSGMRLKGSYITMRNCLFTNSGLAPVGDYIFISDGHHILIEHNDFSQIKAFHNVIAIRPGQQIIFRNNFVRNPWDRIFEVIYDRGNNANYDILFENNVLVDSNLDWTDTNIVDEVSRLNPESPGGDNNKFNPMGGIFRNNLWIGYHNGKQNVYGNLIELGFESPVYGHVRIYHNTFDRNDEHTFRQSASDGFAGIALVKNNIISRQLNHIFYQNYPSGNQGYKQWYFQTNVIGQSQTQGQNLWYINTLGGFQTYAQMISLLPNNFNGNQLVAVNDIRFQQPEVLDQLQGSPNSTNYLNFDVNNLEDFYNAFQLTNSSPGYHQAAPLTQVSQTTQNSTTLPVKDSYLFSTGYGLISGDQITVNGQTARIINLNHNNHTLTLDSSVTTSVNDPVYLTDFPANANVGINNLNNQTSPTLPPIQVNYLQKLSHWLTYTQDQNNDLIFNTLDWLANIIH